jgi:hypothetical protein
MLVRLLIASEAAEAHSYYAEIRTLQR